MFDMNSMMNDLKWRYIATAGILVLSIAASIFVRVREVDRLQDKYLSGYDAYFYYRQAKTIITEGHLPDRDYMQNYPDGLNLRGRANLNCYAIAYLYKGIRILVPDITIERVAIYYPVICFTLTLILLFALTNLLFDKSISLIAVTVFATIPAVVTRTHAGWADRDALSLLIWLACIYFYVAAYQALSQERRHLPLALLSGTSMGILGLTWPGAGLLSIIIIAFNTAKLLTQSYDQKKFYIYLCWYLPSTIMMLIFTERYSSNPHRAYTLAQMALPTILAIVIPTIFAIVTGLYILIRQIKTQSVRRLLSGMLVIGSVILLFVWVPPQQIINTFLHPAGKESFTETVGEFQVPQLSDWLNHYRLFFVFPLLGLLLGTYTITKTYHMHAKSVTGILIITIAAMVLSTHSNMQHRLMEIVYIGSVVLFIGAIVVSYFWRAFNRQKHLNAHMDLLLLLLIWALFALLYNRGSLRLAIFFAPPAVILGAYAIMFILNSAIGRSENQISKLVMLMCFMILTWQLRTPFLAFLINIGLDRAGSALVCANLILLGMTFIFLRGNQELSTEKKNLVIAKATCLTLSMAICIITGGAPYLLPNWISLNTMANIPGPNEIKALNWLKTNTTNKSVIAAWWVHGSRIEALAERATIVDQQHNPSRIHSMAREVLCAETPEKALKFLKSHEATHILIQPIDMYKLEQIFDVGSLQDMNRDILTEQFSIDQQTDDFSSLAQKISPQPSGFLKYTIERYLPCYREDSNTKHVDVEYKSDGSFHKATIRIDDMSISPAYVLFDNKKQEELDGVGSLVVTNVDVHNPYRFLEYKHAVYFDEKASNLLAFQLYFLGSYANHFEQVYPTQESETKDSSPFDDIKIWKINY